MEISLHIPILLQLSYRGLRNIYTYLFMCYLCAASSSNVFPSPITLIYHISTGIGINRIVWNGIQLIVKSTYTNTHRFDPDVNYDKDNLQLNNYSFINNSIVQRHLLVSKVNSHTFQGKELLTRCKVFRRKRISLYRTCINIIVLPIK